MSFLLKPNHVDIWFIDLALQAQDLARCYAVLNVTERAQATRFKFPKLTERYIQVHGLLRFLLARYTHSKAEKLVFAKTTQGKPYLTDYSQLHFNISHSENKLLIAVAPNLIGVDIEAIKPRKSIQDLVARCFATQEQAYWSALPAKQQCREFYQFWTRKEAFVKATGLGIALGLEQCVIDPLNPRYFLSIPAQCGLARDWRLMDLIVGNDCCATVVAKASEFEIIRRELQSFQLTLVTK